MIPSSDLEILALCDDALNMAPAEFPPTLPASKELAGAPAWYSFEHSAWPLGEAIRQAFSHHQRLRLQPHLLSKVAEVATCRNLRRGRQSFVMALGFVSARVHAGALAKFLADPDVDGQIVDTLLKMKATEFANSVAPLMRSEKAWIRRLAQRYLERYPS